jgi:hypothetical protein
MGDDACVVAGGFVGSFLVLSVSAEGLIVELGRVGKHTVCCGMVCYDMVPGH